jgi:hypothetical protein
MQAQERVLYDVLCFIGREAETYEVSKQRLAQFAIQRGGLATGCKARKRQNQGYGIATHMSFCMRL